MSKHHRQDNRPSPMRSPARPGQRAGKALGDDKLRADGVDQEAKGEAQKAEGDVKDAVKKVVDKA